MKRTLYLLLVVALLLCWLPLGAAAAAREVTLSAGDSLDSALEEVADGGTIRVNGTVSVSSVAGHGKAVTITGGTLEFTQNTVLLGDHITFENMTLTFPSGATVYAGGCKVTVGTGVDLTNPITIYGGANGGTVASTELTLLSGTYTAIYGGSRSGTVTGDTHLTVGGTVNSTIDETNHSGSNNVYGGNYGGSIGGTAYTVLTGEAKTHYLYGGSRGGGTITGGTNVTVSGGKMMNASGGASGGTHTGNVKMTITGGTIEQVFGGSTGGAMTGNVELNVLGGTITRRIYGGCYNEVVRNGLSFEWKSTNYVTGTIVLTIGGGASITFTYSENDKAIYAHSRQKTLSNTEVSHLVFADATAYSTYKNSVKAQDFAMQLIMGSTSAADYTHYRTYSASGGVVTQSCICGGCAATATLSTTDATYTGNAIESARVAYSEHWYGGTLPVTYQNNVNAGTASASITKDGATATAQFTIGNADQAAPALDHTDETVKGKADGRISGLTLAMELSADGVTYQPVTDADPELAAGTYYVRYAAKTNYNASPVTVVTIAAGRMLRVTFADEDGTVLSASEYAYGDTVTPPADPTKAADDTYTYTFTGWDQEVTVCTEDVTYTATYTPAYINYTVKFLGEDGTVLSEKTYHWNDPIDIPVAPTKESDEPHIYTYTFTGWDKEVVNCAGHATYTATYGKTYIEYTVIFRNEDGTELSQKTYHYGDTVEQPDDPAKPGDSAGFYAFNGWNPAVTTVSGDAVYTATYRLAWCSYTDNGDGTATLTDYWGTAETLVLPKEIEGLTLTAIGNSAFSGCGGIINIFIPESITSIGERAFYSCTGLKSIALPDSITTVGRYAFYNCGLESITMGSGVTTIGMGAFLDCLVLRDVFVMDPSAWCKIAFENRHSNPMFYANHMHILDRDCNEVTNLVLDSTITIIPDYAFWKCSSITSVTIPDNITTIGEYAFMDCTRLSSVAIGSGITSIGTEAFLNCIGLTDVYITMDMSVWWNIYFGYGADPRAYAENVHLLDQRGDEVASLVLTSTVTTIPVKAFYKFTGLTSIIIPDSVTSIGDSAFSGCTGLTSIIIPDSVTSIGDSAFSGCTGFTSITIPDSVISIGAGALSGCSGLESITIPFVGECRKTASDTDQYPFGYIFGEESYTGSTAADQWYYGPNNGTFDTYYIPTSLRSVTITGGELLGGAFSNCAGITSITIPDNATCVGESAFSGCVGLTSIAIPESVTTIEDYAFRYCTGLASITIPDSVTFIGDSAFSGCTSLTSVTIGSGITTIGKMAFHNSGLKVVFYRGTRKQYNTLGLDLFANVHYEVSEECINGQNCYYCKVCDRHFLPNGEQYSAVITFKNWNGDVISAKIYYRGNQVTPPADPTKAADDTYIYTFAGWDKEVVDCSGDATYTAAYKSTYIDYTVKFLNADGSTISEKTYHYGDEVTAPANPAAPAGYAFQGWDQKVTNCQGNAVYTATFVQTYILGDLDQDTTVNNKDVEYLLWHTLFPEKYPIVGEADFNGDGSINNKDVEYLLWHTLFPKEYPLIPKKKED